VARFADERVGYACGQVRFEGGEGGNQEGLYWRYEMAVRSLETRLGGITAGNGGIYAVRRDAYIELDPSRGQDIGFPFELTKRGWRAVYEPAAIAEERMAPTVEGEFRRKRRMMWGLWDVMLKWGMLDPRGYGLAYAFEIYSHRLLRYLTPWLHLIALAANAALLGSGTVYVVTFALQLAVLGAALIGRFVPALPFRIAYYYVTVTASIAAGLWDRLRAGRVPIGWEKVEGTR
jgi:cellulose synthase/poly-beta-1,6-N-acetylglucosamine synthase-like glycosyltransferase